MCVCFSCMLACTLCVVPTKVEEALKPDSCKPPSRCWELNTYPLQEQKMSLTTESFLQPPVFEIFIFSKDRCSWWYLNQVMYLNIDTQNQLKHTNGNEEFYMV